MSKKTFDTNSVGAKKLVGFPIYAYGDFIIVDWPMEPEELKSLGGIIVTQNEKTNYFDTAVANALSVGPGGRQVTTVGPVHKGIEVEPGDQIIFPKVRMKNIRIQGVDYGCVMEQDVLGILDKKVIPDYRPPTSINTKINRGGFDILEGEPGNTAKY